jgi:hypothetical protein
LAELLSGLAAIGIGLFPMEMKAGVLGSVDDPARVQLLRDAPHGPLGWHFGFVGVFFLLTFYLVTFRFRANTPLRPTRQKERRNRIYPVCGAVMALSFAWIAWLWYRDEGGSIFWPETLAVMAFSAAWLVKGQLVLKDEAGAAPTPDA